MAKSWLFLLCAGWLTVWSAHTPVRADETLPLATATVVERTVPDELILEGTVEAIHQATVTAKTSGTVVEINVDVTDFVQEGAVLLRFQGRVNQAGLLQARAGLTGASANLLRAEREYLRLATLFEQKTATTAQMDQARANLDAARSTVEANQAQVTTANEGVTDTVVRAPYSGYVVKRFIQLGETASIGTPLFSGLSLDALRVQTAVPQARMAQVRQHNHAEVLLADNKRVTAKSLVFFPYADDRSHDFPVRLLLPPGLEGVFPGTWVKTFFTVGERTSVLVPEAAVVRRSELTAVYVVQGAAVTLQPVVTGVSRPEGWVEILSGLQAGAQVAMDPVRAGQYLHAKRPGGAL